MGTNRRPGIASSPRGALGSGPRGWNPKDPPHLCLGHGWPSGQPTPHIYVPVRVPSEIPEFRETIKTPKICSYWKDIGSRLCGYTRAGNFGDGSRRPAVHSKKTAERRLHRSPGGGIPRMDPGGPWARTTTGEWGRATTKLKKTVSDFDVLYARLVPHVVRPLPSYHIQTWARGIRTYPLLMTRMASNSKDLDEFRD